MNAPDPVVDSATAGESAHDSPAWRTIDHVFRHEYARLVAILTRQLGPGRLGLVEDVVQDALMRAAQVWPYHGVPSQPTAWLLTTARRRAIDICRRDTRWRDAQPIVEHEIELTLARATAAPEATFADELHDARLRMMFVCCHPGLSTEAQLALMLKTLAGFSENEIAAAFLVSRPTIAKRLVRARRFLREANVTMDLPTPTELDARTGPVLHALYLLFSEGYKASSGESVTRDELCHEARRLLDALQTTPIGQSTATAALQALMCFHLARRPGRTDLDGDALLLSDQDRCTWDRNLIQTGIQHLVRSGQGEHLTRYHLEAGIAACHCLAPTYAATDWVRIESLYDQLHSVAPSPIVTLNHAVALARVKGPQTALRLIDDYIPSGSMTDYHLYHAVRAELLHETGDPAARKAYTRALELAPLFSERRALSARLASLG